MRPSAYFKSVAAQVLPWSPASPTSFRHGTHTRSNPIGQNDSQLDSSTSTPAHPSLRSSSYHVEIDAADLTPRQQSEIIFELAGRGTATCECAIVWADRSSTRSMRGARATIRDTRRGSGVGTHRAFLRDGGHGPSDPRYAAERLVDFYEERVSEERAKLVAAKAGATDDDLGLRDEQDRRRAYASSRVSAGGATGLARPPSVRSIGGSVCFRRALRRLPPREDGLLLAESAEHFHRVIS